MSVTLDVHQCRSHCRRCRYRTSTRYMSITLHVSLIQSSLLKVTATSKHSAHVRHIGCVPVADLIGEGVGNEQHERHMFVTFDVYLLKVPILKVSVTTSRWAHIRYIGCLPDAELVVKGIGIEHAPSTCSSHWMYLNAQSSLVTRKLPATSTNSANVRHIGCVPLQNSSSTFLATNTQWAHVRHIRCVPAAEFIDEGVGIDHNTRRMPATLDVSLLQSSLL